MNQKLYNTAMDRLHMSGECEERILETTENITQSVSKRNKKKFRILPVLAAAAVLVTGTLTVAAESGAFDWIRGFFKDEKFEITDDIAGLVADMENFVCESPSGIEVSPIGTIAEECTIYCMLRVDSLPKGLSVEDLRLNGFSTDKLLAEQNIGFPLGVEIGASTSFGTSTTSLERNEKDENTLMLTFRTSYKAFNDGDKVMIRLSTERDECNFNEFEKNAGNYADITFNVRFGDVGFLEKNYDEYQAIEVSTDKFFIKKLTVSPMRIAIVGLNLYNDKMEKNNSIKIVLKDGSVVRAYFTGSGNMPADIRTITSYDLSSATGARLFVGEWEIEKPINPDNISTIYIRDICLYDSEQQ